MNRIFQTDSGLGKEKILFKNEDEKGVEREEEKPAGASEATDSLSTSKSTKNLEIPKLRSEFPETWIWINVFNG